MKQKMFSSKEEWAEKAKYVVVNIPSVGPIYTTWFTNRKSAENSEDYFHNGFILTRKQFEKEYSKHKDNL